MSAARDRSAGRPARAAALVAALAWSGVGLADVPSALAPSLDGAPKDGWARYDAPLAGGREGPCCHQIDNGVVHRLGCDLDRSGGMIVQSGDAASNGASESLRVYLHFRDGQIDAVKSYGSSCPVRADAEPAQLSLSVDQSVRLLDLLAASPERERVSEGALVALAQHAGEAATDALVALSGEQHPRGLRKDAVFWLGQARGERGAEAVAAIARGDASPALREHAVFALSQSDAIDPFPILEQIARSDDSAKVRSQTLFWMAQTGDPRAADAILTAAHRDSHSEVQEQAVFALSQLHDGAGDQALIGIVRGDHPRHMKKKALFWLAQSGSPEALRFIDEALGAR